jgi:hypothetical protein
MVGFAPFLKKEFTSHQKDVDTINGDNILHLAVRYRDLDYFKGNLSSIGIPNFTERNKQKMTPI